MANRELTGGVGGGGSGAAADDGWAKVTGYGHGNG
jgi:hypothetical protein